MCSFNNKTAPTRPTEIYPKIKIKKEREIAYSFSTETKDKNKIIAASLVPIPEIEIGSMSRRTIKGIIDKKNM